MEPIIFLILILLSAFSSVAETAFFTLSESNIRLMVKHKEPNARVIARLKKDPQRLLVTLLIINNVVNISIASLATVVAMNYFESFGAGIATGLSAIVILLFGELFPKSFGISHKKIAAQWTAYPLFFCYIVCAPASLLFVTIEKMVRKKFKTVRPDLVSEEEIRIVVELGLEHGEIHGHERQMIENVFNFDDITVGSIATPKRMIESLNGEVPVAQIAYFVSQSGFSRFPVYDGSQNNYIGYVHTNDVMRILNSDDRDLPLSKVILPMTRVSAESPIEGVFRQMSREHSHMYLVHKTGNPEKIIGLVTMEDILEELVGEIEDEGDHREKKEQAKQKIPTP